MSDLLPSKKETEEFMRNITRKPVFNKLESNVKTLKELQSEVYWLYQAGKWPVDSKEEEAKIFKGMDEKWVPLKVAQKEIKERDLDLELNHAIIKDLEQKLERIQKMLEVEIPNIREIYLAHEKTGYYHEASRIAYEKYYELASDLFERLKKETTK